MGQRRKSADAGQAGMAMSCACQVGKRSDNSRRMVAPQSAGPRSILRVARTAAHVHDMHVGPRAPGVVRMRGDRTGQPPDAVLRVQKRTVAFNFCVFVSKKGRPARGELGCTDGGSRPRGPACW